MNQARTTAPADGVLESARRVIQTEAAAIAALEARLDQKFLHAVEVVLNAPGRVIVSGIGKSGIIARKVAATLTSTGTPASGLPCRSVTRLCTNIRSPGSVAEISAPCGVTLCSPT